MVFDIMIQKWHEACNNFAKVSPSEVFLMAATLLETSLEKSRSVVKLDVFEMCFTAWLIVRKTGERGRRSDKGNICYNM